MGEKFREDSLPQAIVIRVIEMYSERPLFGGAISCDIPSAWRDVSDVRQVPDHQECWQEIDGAVLVVEILDRQEVGDHSAASFFFADLARAMEFRILRGRP